MPSSPAFLVPATQDQAIAQLEEHGDDAVVVAGSTAITIMLQQGLIDPRLMVSLGRIDELRGLHVNDGQMANVRVRNAATVGLSWRRPTTRQALRRHR